MKLNPAIALIFFVGVSFIYFGISCLFTKFMEDEFIRYNLASYRKIIGILQLMGAFGLLVGLYASPKLIFFAAAGLGILMLAGFAVRLYIKDSFLLSSPSFIYAVLCILICYIYYPKL